LIGGDHQNIVANGSNQSLIFDLVKRRRIITKVITNIFELAKSLSLLKIGEGMFLKYPNLKLILIVADLSEPVLLLTAIDSMPEMRDVLLEDHILFHIDTFFIIFLNFFEVVILWVFLFDDISLINGAGFLLGLSRVFLSI